ncbi:MAG: hypothetical protein M9962_09390 [Oligoflexia bacterium]|nr:hypothetical protein [Oligoflexia bacterium]
MVIRDLSASISAASGKFELFIIGSSLFFFISCATTTQEVKKIPPTAQPPKQMQNSSPPKFVEEKEDLPEKDFSGQQEDLRYTLSLWLEENPNASFDEAIKEANRLLNTLGYPAILDVAKNINKRSNTTSISSKKRKFVFHSGEELSPSTDICGERYLKIPIKITGTYRAYLVSEKKNYLFSMKKFRRDEIKIYKGKKILNRIYLPEPTEPIGVDEKGKAIFIKFPLAEGMANTWWNAISNQLPSILGEDPYLTVRVEKNSLRFETALENLPPQEFDIMESTKQGFRWRFSPSDLVLELPSKCGA